ncbi:MAG: hypothetical protein C0615_04175 [Desulfuromonas sp.]|nr:MAG: hypothetical protein C0615_04175 [Desulfuromonas sp.]
MELLVAFFILVALLVIIVPTYFNYLDKAKLTLARNTVDSIGKALDSYKHQRASYPATIDFTTGKTDSGMTVFTSSLLEQIDAELSSIESYTGSATDYTLTVRATDEDRTVITLTPKAVIY